MGVKLNRPPKSEESQKNSNFNGKTLPYPGFEPGTSGLNTIKHQFTFHSYLTSEFQIALLPFPTDRSNFFSKTN
jgi:hypothetical protein